MYVCPSIYNVLVFEYSNMHTLCIVVSQILYTYMYKCIHHDRRIVLCTSCIRYSISLVPPTIIVVSKLSRNFLRHVSGISQKFPRIFEYARGFLLTNTTPRSQSTTSSSEKSWCHRGGTVMKYTRDTVSRPRCYFPRMIYAINQPNLKG